MKCIAKAANCAWSLPAASDCAWTHRFTAKGYHPASLIAEGCTGCAICAIVCPEAAITVYREDLRAPPRESPLEPRRRTWHVNYERQ